MLPVAAPQNSDSTREPVGQVVVPNESCMGCVPCAFVADCTASQVTYVTEREPPVDGSVVSRSLTASPLAEVEVLFRKELDEMFDAQSRKEATQLQELRPQVCGDMQECLARHVQQQKIMLEHVFAGRGAREAPTTLKGEGRIADTPRASSADYAALEVERGVDEGDVAADDPGGEGKGALQRQCSHLSFRVQLTQISDWVKMQFSTLPSFERKGAPKRGLKKVVDSRIFRISTWSLILLNALFLGWSANVTVKSELRRLDGGRDPETGWWAVRHVFNGLFLLELVVRVAAGRREFFFGAHWSWNWFDLVLLVILPAACIAKPAQDARKRLDSVPDVSVFRICRVFRMICEYQVFRQPIFIELRMMTNSTLSSMPSFCWSVGLGFFWMYIFGVGFVLGVAQFLEAQEVGHKLLEIEALKRRFSSFTSAVENLFMAISAGHDWGGVEAHMKKTAPALYDAILVLPTVYHYFFFLFIVFMLFALLNIVSGMFTDRAFKVVSRDRDYGILQEASQQHMYENRMKGLFYQLDEDGSGTVTWNELEKQLDNPLVLAYFGWLGINVSRACDVFDLLDLDGSGDIEIEEFLKGCKELRGPATNIEVKMLRNLIEDRDSRLAGALAGRRRRSTSRVMKGKVTLARARTFSRRRSLSR